MRPASVRYSDIRANCWLPQRLVKEPFAEAIAANAPITHQRISICQTSKTSPARISMPKAKSPPPLKAGPAKLPSDTFLWAAGGSIAASLALKVSGRDHAALFVGQWAPDFSAPGHYSKLVVRCSGPILGTTWADESPGQTSMP